MRRFVWSLLSAALAIATPALAEGFREGPWVGAPIVEKGELQFCLMAGHMETGGMMALALTPDEKLIVLLERKSWELPSALDPLLKLSFDKRRSVPVFAEAASEEALMLHVGDHEAFLLGMAKAKSVTIEHSGNQRFTFPYAPPAAPWGRDPAGG